MQCTAEEIERKRQIALQKLKQKQSPARSNLESAKTKSSPNFRFKSTNLFNKHNVKPYEQPKEKQQPTTTTTQFYGNDKKITGKCTLISNTRFSVVLSEFSAVSIDIFKTIPTRFYNSQNRQWDFHINDYNLLLTKFQSLKPHVTIEPFPTYLLNFVKQPRKDYSTIDLSSVEPELGNSLMPFQQEGVRYAIDKNGRCLIGDDMGLGKTFQALAVASYYKTDWPLLIVTTASMKNVWQETIIQYLPSVSIMQVQYMTSAKDFIGEAVVLIVSYDLMSRCLDKLSDKNFGVIIMDESHTLKNFRAKCTQAASALAKRAKRVVLLSGTPALSRPAELYSQLALIDEKFFGTFSQYSKRYCDGHQTAFGWDSSGKSNLQELEIILNSKFMIRRTKEDVLKSLPNKVQEVVTLDVKLNEFSAEDRNCLNALAAKYQRNAKGSQNHSILLTFFSETAKIKIPAVCSYILQVLQSKQKFLVFAHHQIMLNAISSLLSKKSVKFIRIDGATSSEQRKLFVDKFQTNDECLVAVLSITAANAGITLTAAQLVLFAELHWNPSILSQAESRAHRIGQASAVFVKYLLAPGTADDSIWPLLKEKEKILSEVGLSKASFKDAACSKQVYTSETHLTENLDVSLNRTVADTLDIKSFFRESPKKESFCDESCFDDGLNDVLGSMEF